MLRMAVCDDDREHLALTKSRMEEYQRLRPSPELSVSTFTTGAALLEHVMAKGPFDLYLLDILMPGESGIQVGLKLRELDRGGLIVYLTSSPDFAVDSYGPRALQYLLKPVEAERLFAVLDEAVEIWADAHASFVTVKTKRGLQRLSTHSLVYGELVGHCIRYHLADGSMVESTSLRRSFREAVAPLLEHLQFALCAASFVVNLSFVDMVETDGLRLVGGGLLPLSRSLRSQVTNRWLDYHLEGVSEA